MNPQRHAAYRAAEDRVRAILKENTDDPDSKERVVYHKPGETSAFIKLSGKTYEFPLVEIREGNA